MADGKQCDRCNEWERVADGDLLPSDWSEEILPHGLSVQGRSKLDLCPHCAREFSGAKVMAAQAYTKEFKERFWPK